MMATSTTQETGQPRPPVRHTTPVQRQRAIADRTVYYPYPSAPQLGPRIFFEHQPDVQMKNGIHFVPSFIGLNSITIRILAIPSRFDSQGAFQIVIQNVIQNPSQIGRNSAILATFERAEENFRASQVL